MIGLQTTARFDGQALQELERRIGRTLGAVQTGAHEWAVYEVDPDIQANLAGKVLKRRTGHLAQSERWTFEVFGKKSIRANLWALAYGWVHEHGPVTLRPKHSKFLAIPLEAALTGAGVLKKPARAWANTFVAKGTIFQRHKGGAVPLFLLRREVTIPRRQWARPAVLANKHSLPGYINRAIADHLRGVS